MTPHLLIDIGNTKAKIALFLENQMQSSFSFSIKGPFQEHLQSYLSKSPIEHALISSVNVTYEPPIKAILNQLQIPFTMLDFSKIKMKLEVDEPHAVGHDRIANCYGALHHFPTHDCVIVDIGTALTFDYVTKEGAYVGGAIYPGNEICAKGLAQYTDKLPFVDVVKPLSALAKTTKTHIQSGIYFGMLGAIERIIFELKQTSSSPSSVQILATGGATAIESESVCAEKVDFLHDLKDLVDYVDPYLTLVGLNEIYKELLQKNKEK